MALRLRTVLQKRDNAAIVPSQERLEDKTGKELVLRELLRTETVTVGRQLAFGNELCRDQHLPWRLGCCAHP